MRGIPKVDNVGFNSRTYLKWLYDPYTNVKSIVGILLHRIDQNSAVSLSLNGFSLAEC